MDQVVTTMKGINDSSKKISDIIGLIDEIASQTDILALNVAVEAARAGEQGMGFAVAASQVPPVTSKPFPAWIRARNKTPRRLTSLPSQPSRSSRRRRR